MAKQKTSRSLDAQAKLRQSVNTVLAALLCILIGLLVGLVVLFIINPGHAWDQGFMRIIQGGFYDFPYGVGRTLVNGAPLIMTGLSVAFAFKTGLFNIGAAGQYTLGAFGGLYCALVLHLPWFVCLLASALLGDPKLLILDEPTAGLDPKERVRLRTLLAQMAADRIILVATHVVSDVETVATEVILLRAGQIVDAAPVPDLIAKYAPGQGLEDVYLAVFGEGDGK